MFKLYDTVSRKKRLFRPITRKMVKIYSCGPTVYNYAHIGNLSTYLFVDLLKRYLRYSGYAVEDVMNFTDIDDKTIKASREKGVSLKEYTEIFGKAILDDFHSLNILEPKTICKATEHIGEMLDLIKVLTQKGYAYKSDDGSVYFDLSKFKSYGRFAGIKKSELKVGAGGRVSSDEYEKKNVSDFVLWKAWTDGDGSNYWDSPFGKGRPGWHIECSAMSMKYLGSTLDIHTGAVDLIFPHHQNEIAQSEAATGQKFVRYWLHRAFLNINNVKMAKSLGNFYTLREITKKVSNPLAFRYLALVSHYRQPIFFTFESLQGANEALGRLWNFIDRVSEQNGENSETKLAFNKIKKEVTSSRNGFKRSLDDDLNTPIAIASLHAFVGKVNKFIDRGEVGLKASRLILGYIREIDQVWGFLLPLFTNGNNDSQEKAACLIAERDNYRKNGNWAKADEIKSILVQMGISIKDTPGGTKWKFVET